MPPISECYSKTTLTDVIFSFHVLLLQNEFFRVHVFEVSLAASMSVSCFSESDASFPSVLPCKVYNRIVPYENFDVKGT